MQQMAVCKTLSDLHLSIWIKWEMQTRELRGIWQ
jgi:hypothetical protein